MRKVIRTETSGETFSGRSARTVISRKSQGRERIRSVKPRARRSQILSLPWLFLLITVRALLPLNVSPLVSVLITFLILGLLGWAASARVLSTSADALHNSDFVLQARSSGLHGTRLFLVHVLPHLTPFLYAQFWISIPVFLR